MTYQETEALIHKYLNGETTADEEKLLALEVSREDAPDDWKIIAGMLGELTIDEARFDQMMAERKHKTRFMKQWLWVAAACVVALLVVFLTPPKEEAVTQPSVAKVVPKTKVVEAETAVTKEKEERLTASEPRQIGKVKRRERVSKRMKSEKPATLIAQEAEPKGKTDGLVAGEGVVHLVEPEAVVGHCGVRLIDFSVHEGYGQVVSSSGFATVPGRGLVNPVVLFSETDFLHPVADRHKRSRDTFG